MFHGGNATTAYNLLACDFLLQDFHIYGVDIIGHPGRSAETSLPARGYAYGQWAGEVIAGLGYDRMSLFGGSFGGGIVAKAMCEAPERVKRAVMYIPSGIRNAPAIKSARMMIPIILYWTTHREKWLKRCFLPMAITEDNITDDIFETAKLSIDYVKVKDCAFAREHEDDFVKMVEKKTRRQGEDAVREGEKEYAEAKKRIEEIDQIINQLYEDKVSGGLSAERFSIMLTKYEEEQETLRGNAKSCRCKSPPPEPHPTTPSGSSGW